MRTHQILLMVVIGSFWGRVCRSNTCEIDVRDSSRSCATHTAVVLTNDSRNVIDLEDLESPILIITDHRFYSGNAIAGCFYLDRTSGDQKLVLMFTTTVIPVIILSLSVNSSINGITSIPQLGVCNVSCDFNIWNAINGSCSIGHYELAAMIQNSRSGCYSNASIRVYIEETGIKVTFDNGNDFSINGYEEITNNCTVTTTTTKDHPTSASIQDLQDGAPQSLSTPVTIGMSISISTLAVLIIILVVVFWVYMRGKAVKQKQDLESQDDPYSTHQEENTEIEPNRNIPWQPQADLQGIYSCISTGQPKPTSQGMDEDSPMYAAIGNESNKEQHNGSHNGPPVLSNNQDIAVTDDKASAADDSDAFKKRYALVNKKVQVEKEESAPVTSSHMVDISCIPANQKNPNSDIVTTVNDRAEELYTTVKKRLKGDEYEEVAPPIPPHTVEELYSAVMKKPKGNAEAEEQVPPTPPYTADAAVKRDSRDKAENEEVAPPIPPHTVEELYTAVMKKPKENVEDEEKPPPVPPYMVDKL